MMSEHKTARSYRDPYLLAKLSPLLRAANAEAANRVLPRDIARLLEHQRELETGPISNQKTRRPALLLKARSKGRKLFRTR